MFGVVVVGTDGSDTAKEAVRQAAELAQSHGAQLNVVSAYETVHESRLWTERGDAPRDRDRMMKVVEATLSEAADQVEGVKVETFSREGDPADAILDVAEERGADLIVVGNKGMTGAKRFLLGSVPNKVSHHAPCSVLIVRTT
jgi:nucleotide-binding universal stress UspA family protein